AHEALVMAKQYSLVERERDTLVDLTRLESRAGKPGLATVYGKQAVNILQAMRRDIAHMAATTRQALVESHAKFYRELADLLISQGRLPEAEQVLGMLKREEFFEFVRRDPQQAREEESIAATPSEAAALRHYAEIAKVMTEQARQWGELRRKTKAQ